MRTYSFNNVAITVEGVEIRGFAKGDDVFQAMQREDGATDEVGADGDMLVALSADRSGEIRFRLQQSAPANRVLQQFYAVQQEGNGSALAIGFRDLRTNDVVNGAAGYIKKPADIVRGQGVNAQEWTLIVEKIDLLYGIAV
jgi:hypothetical protein